MKANCKKIIIISAFLITLILLIFLILKNEKEKVDWDQSITNYITLEDNNSSIIGNGVTINRNTININYSGIYELTGKLTNGKININIKDEGNVKLILNSVDITSSNETIYIENTKNTIILLKENSINKLADSNNSRDNDSVIYSKDDLIIEGTGSLEIESNYLDGISSKDTLTINDGTYIINSKDDSIKGKDYVEINNGTFKINSIGDAIKSTNTDNNDLGYIIINNGIFNSNSTLDFIDAESTVIINNGTFNIVTGEGSNNSSNNSMGMWKNDTTTISAKGIKGTDITINNGIFNIDTEDDSIHSNSNLLVNNGNFIIKSGDDGIHADNSIKIENGTFEIEKSYEGIESSIITINNGNIHIISSDDGINIAGGNDLSSMNRPGENKININNNQKLTINDGYIYVDSYGDGLDSNGSIYINGGTVIVNGPTNDGNGALDYDLECVVDGGTLISAGASGMLQSPSNTSSINTISIVFDTSINSIINIEDELGNEILTFKPNKSIKSLVFSSDLLKKNNTYKIYIDGTYSKESVDGIYTNGNYNGTLYKSVTLTSNLTSVGNIKTNNTRGMMR